jgi:hypothetical protein
MLKIMPEDRAPYKSPDKFGNSLRGGGGSLSNFGKLAVALSRVKKTYGVSSSAL